MSRRGVASLGCALGVLSALLKAPIASACQFPEIAPFRIDRTQFADDTEAPEAFHAPTAYTYRIDAERCTKGTCTASSCGDLGWLLVQFEPPAEATAGALGYRLQWLSGEIPAALRAQLERIMPLDPNMHAIGLNVGWNVVAQLEGELALIAIDQAGNESEPSEPVHVSWSGCTEYFDDPFCAEDKVVVSPESEQRCALVAGPRVGSDRGLPLAAACVLGMSAALGLRMRRRKR